MEEMPELPGGLRALAEQAMSNARREMEQTGKLNPAIFYQLATGETIPLKLTDAMADMWFSSPSRRDAFFRYLREVVEVSKATAVVLVSDIWTAKQTEKFNALPEEEQERAFKEAINIEELVKTGLGTRCEAILVHVQTAEQVTLIEQLYERHRGRRKVAWLERTVKSVPQEYCTGRIKVFGEVSE